MNEDPDLLFHLRAHQLDLCFELAQRITEHLGANADVVDEVHGFRSFDERDLLGFVDGTANPYLALAGILGVGLYGIQSEAQLKIQDSPGPVSSAQMMEEARQKLAITRRMSLTWEESRKSY